MLALNILCMYHQETSDLLVMERTIIGQAKSNFILLNSLRKADAFFGRKEFSVFICPGSSWSLDFFTVELELILHSMGTPTSQM